MYLPKFWSPAGEMVKKAASRRNKKQIEGPDKDIQLDLNLMQQYAMMQKLNDSWKGMIGKANFWKYANSMEKETTQISIWIRKYPK